MAFGAPGRLVWKQDRVDDNLEEFASIITSACCKKQKDRGWLFSRKRPLAESDIGWGQDLPIMMTSLSIFALWLGS